MIRSIGFAVTATLLCPQPVSAQLVLQPQAPPPVVEPAGRALNDAYGSIQFAIVSSPAAAQAANFAYANALARYRSGDYAGATSEAASAIAIVGGAALAPGSPPLAAASGTSVLGAPVRRVGAPAVLPDYILSTRVEILRAMNGGADVSVATDHLRRAIDDYTIGDAARAQREARAARRAASQ